MERARGLSESDLVADEHGRVDARLELAAVDECAVGASGVVQEYLVAAFGELEHRVEARRGRVLEDHVVVGGAAEGEATAPAAVDDVDDGAVLEHLEGEVRGREAAPLGLDVSAAGGRGRGRGGGSAVADGGGARVSAPWRATRSSRSENRGAEAASPTSRPEPRGCARPRRSAGGRGHPHRVARRRARDLLAGEGNRAVPSSRQRHLVRSRRGIERWRKRTNFTDPCAVPTWHFTVQRSEGPRAPAHRPPRPRETRRPSGRRSPPPSRR